MKALSPDTPQVAEVKAAVEDLIATVGRGDMSILDRIYHDDMETFMFAGGGVVHTADKAGFTQQMHASVKDHGPPNSWAKFHSVAASETHGHVVISRKAKLSATEEIITLSIDFVFEKERWQIIREVIRV